MLGQLYERALGGEGCWIRDARGGVSDLPVGGDPPSARPRAADPSAG